MFCDINDIKSSILYFSNMDENSFNNFLLLAIDYSNSSISCIIFNKSSTTTVLVAVRLISAI
jgi:hypothetical protein